MTYPKLVATALVFALLTGCGERRDNSAQQTASQPESAAQSAPTPIPNETADVPKGQAANAAAAAAPECKEPGVKASGVCDSQGTKNAGDLQRR
jgi:hypothetical protein